MTHLYKKYPVLSVSLFVSSLLLFNDLPIWGFVLSLLFWFWLLFCFVFNFKTPSRFVTGLLSVLAFIVVLIDFGTLLGKEPAASFLIILTGLKALEFSKDDEKDFLVLLGFFLISSKFLFSYDLMYLIFSIPIYLVLTIHLFPTDWYKSHQSIAHWYLAKIILLAIPMATFMFIFFPRLTKTLMEIPSTSRLGTTGFSDSISPGSIAKLAQSNELVLRLELLTKNMTVKDLYLSSLILEKNNLMTWMLNRDSFNLIKTTNPTEVDYRIILEPSYKFNLFSLKNTAQLFSESYTIFKDSNLLFRTDTMIDKKIILIGSLGSADYQIDETILSKNLEVSEPKNNELAYKNELFPLIKSFKTGSNGPEDVNKKILDYFSSNHFQYTLEPGDQPLLSLPDFLFKFKKGYCEHFASAHALLLRLSGVPARVVIGYQGGDYNSIGNFWTVRQKDSHAWVEYLNSNKKWALTDPVTVVAPQRIELGASLYSSSINELLSTDELKSKISNDSIFSKLAMWMDSINYQWSTFLLEFDIEKQKDILKSLNLNLGQGLIIILLALFTVSITINFFQKKGNIHSSTELAFYFINDWASLHRLEKYNSEGPLVWKNRILANFNSPTTKADINQIFNLWIEMSYQPSSIQIQKQTLQKIKKRIKSLRDAI